MPDSISQASRLKNLILGDCRKLVKLSESIGLLNELEYLKIWSCISLKALPDSIRGLSKLRHLYVYFCTSLTSPPPIQFCSSLELLWLRANTNYQTFSASYFEGAWTQLMYMHLQDCHGLASLLDYGALKSLQGLHVEDKTLTEFP